MPETLHRASLVAQVRPDRRVTWRTCTDRRRRGTYEAATVQVAQPFGSGGPMQSPLLYKPEGAAAESGLGRTVTPTGRSVPHRPGGVVSLAAERRRRLARDLGIGPTAPVPCGPGPCTCYGAELGCGA